jgi:lipopolysaccharide biosynthesis glycosyltransferase
MSRDIAITGFNSEYEPVAKGLLSSIEDGARADDLAIGILDLGLTEDHKNLFKRRGFKVVTPDWDYDLRIFETMPNSYFKVMTARPHLPKYFPGFDRYVWFDADTWVQDWKAIRVYMAAAARYSFAVTPECDRSYFPIYEWAFRGYLTCFNPQVAQQLASFPSINSGVFAAMSNAPHWQKWSEILAEIFKRTRKPLFFSEQNALNVVIRAAGLRTAFLPSTYNWVCHRAKPMCTEDGTILLEPNPPFQPLSVVHLTAETKNGRHTIMDVAGKAHFRSLRFRENSADVEPDLGALPSFLK